MAKTKQNRKKKLFENGMATGQLKYAFGSMPFQEAEWLGTHATALTTPRKPC